MPDHAFSKIQQLAGFEIPAVRQTLQHFLKLSIQLESTQNVHNSKALFDAIELDPSLLAVFITSSKEPIKDLASWYKCMDTTRFREFALMLCNQYAHRDCADVHEQYYFSQWQKSYLQGEISGALATQLKENQQRYRLLGRLSNIGQHFLATTFGDSYINFAKSESNPHILLQHEQSQFGFGANQLAARILNTWGLSPALTDGLCYQQAELSELAEASNSVKIIAFSRLLMNSVGSVLQQDLIDSAEVLFGIDDNMLNRILFDAENALSKVRTLLSFEKSSFADDVANANMAANIKSTIENAESSVSQLAVAEVAEHVFGVSHLAHFTVNDDELVSCFDDLDLLSIDIQSTSSVVARAYREQKNFTAEREVLSSIVDKQLLQRLKASTVHLLHLGPKAGVLALGCHHGQQLEPTLLAVFHAAVFKRFNMSVEEGMPLLQLDYVQARVNEVTHEVNNPLAIVQNYLHMLALKIDEDSPVQADIKTITREMHRVSGIVKKYGQIGAQDDMLREEVNVNDLIAQLINIFRGGNADINIETNFDSAMPKVLITPDCLKQVIINLVKNALEAFDAAVDMTADATIKISTHGSINFGGDQYIEILVNDNGPGVPMSIRDKLFQANNSSKGAGHSGLGLSIVKSLLVDMGGLISCKTQVEGEGSPGTSFQILIPLVDNN